MSSDGMQRYEGLAIVGSFESPRRCGVCSARVHDAIGTSARGRGESDGDENGEQKRVHAYARVQSLLVLGGASLYLVTLTALWKWYCT